MSRLAIAWQYHLLVKTIDFTLFVFVSSSAFQIVTNKKLCERFGCYVFTVQWLLMNWFFKYILCAYWLKNCASARHACVVENLSIYNIYILCVFSLFRSVHVSKMLNSQTHVHEKRRLFISAVRNYTCRLVVYMMSLAVCTQGNRRTNER